MKEWKRYKLEDLLSIPVRNGLTKPSSIRGKGVKMIGMGELFANEIIRDIEMPRVPTTDSELKLSAIEKGDLLFARQSLTLEGAGKCSLVKEVTEPTVFESHIIRCRVNKNLVIPEYLYYYFRSRFGRYKIECIVEQVAAAGIRGKDLIKIEIPVPDIPTQRGIVDCLSTLDEKIHYNSLINDNLEQQAQAAFNNIIAHYSECETINLSEIAVLNPKRAIAKGTLARSIEMAHLPTSGSFPAGWDMKEYNGGMKFQNGDTLMARITPCLENGKVTYINFLEENEVAFGSTEYIVIASKGAIAPEVFYFLTRHNDFVDFAVKNMNGSSGRQRVSAETIGTYKLPVISPEDLVILETIAKEALNKIKYNSLENIRLSEIRDTLLPKLMSGELKINEIDC